MHSLRHPLFTVIALLAGNAVWATDNPPAVAASHYTDARSVERKAPRYPDAALRRNQEGWVIVSFCVAEDGTVVDPFVSDSSGVRAFELAALHAARGWLYEPATRDGEQIEQCHTLTQIVFAIETNRRGASRKFIRQYQKANSLIADGDVAAAAAIVADMDAAGRWNLYEYSRIWLLKSSLAQLQGNEREQLRALRRSVGKKGEFIDESLLTQVLPVMLHLELKLSRFPDALDTYEQIQALDVALDGYEFLEPALERLQRVIDSDDVFSVPGEIAACDDCDNKWAYRPLRRDFTFDSIEGQVDKFELRCDWRRYEARIDPDLSWTIPASWGDCRLYVTGEPGTTFRLLEFAAAGQT